MTKRKDPADYLPLGRPTKYSPEMTELICKRVATSTLGLTTLCEMYDDMPDKDTVNEWRFRYPEFSAKYLEAKRFQAELIAEEIDDIAKDVAYYFDHEGNQRIDPPSASLAIARANNKKWMASRLAPKIYGDKKQEENNSPQETLDKIQALVADLNKTTISHD